MPSRNSRKRKLSYGEEAGKVGSKPLPEQKHTAENVVGEEWKRRMESFDLSSSMRKKLFTAQTKIPASLVALRFSDLANSLKTEPSQESEIDIDWLPSSDEEEFHIYETQRTDEDAEGVMTAVDRSHWSHCTEGSVPDESTPDIEFVSSPAVQKSPFILRKPVIINSPVMMRHSPVIDSSPVIENSPVIQHCPVIENSPVSQRCPVIDSSPVIQHSLVIENSLAVQRSPACENSRVSPVIHSRRKSCLQKSVPHLISCATEDQLSKTTTSSDSSDDGDGNESVSRKKNDCPSQVSHSEVPISQYESEEDGNSPGSGDDERLEAEDADETVSISSPPGSQLESNPGQPVPVHASSSKGRDLIEGLQRYFLTPEKNLQPEDVAAAESTTKKRQKFLKGGFAERLNKLATRQRTATSCWLHKNRTTSGNAVSDRVLVCDVTSCVADHGHLVAKCKVTRDCRLDASAPTESLVLFNQETAHHCKIIPGSVLKIYPPWQSLKLDNWEIILNTNLCQVESQEGDCRVKHQVDDKTLGPERILATWSCPCSLDPSSCSAACRQGLGSALRSSVFPRPSAVLGSAKSSGLASGGATVTLETCSLSTIVPLAQETLISSSILESIEQNGGSFAMEINFYATIQRIFCRVVPCSSGQSGSGESGVNLLTGSRIQWSLLVQDLHGFLCEVVLPQNFQLISVWHEVTTAALGSQWAFYNLQVGRRLTRPKFGRLFSVIDSVWKLDSMSEVGPRDSASSHHEMCAPSFCYALHAADLRASCRLWSPATAQVFSPPSYRSLQGITVDKALGRSRVSFGARLLHKLELELVQHFYVTDSSLQEETTTVSQLPYVVIVVSNAVVIGSDCSKQLPIVFHDVYVESGQFLADEYSLLMAGEGSRWLSVMEFSPRLPLLTVESELHSLVTVSGCITDVDEETACAWSVCDLCENSELGTSLQNTFLYCHICERPVTNPLTKMKLDVCLAVSTLSNIVVKVKLLQNTIELLLPSTEFDGGYDIEQVLGHEIDQLTCFVTAVMKIGQCIKEIDVEEISLCPS